MLDEIVKEFSELPQVEAIALGGSRATGQFDDSSDYDLYIYVSTLPETEARRNILEKHCSITEIGNAFWETEDDCVLNNGINLDIIYRSPCDFAALLEKVFDKTEIANNYNTCLLYNLQTCKILFDRNDWLAALQRRYTKPYPETLKKAIVKRQLLLLCDALPALDKQLLKACERQDKVAVIHRAAEFAASYFDLIFALNGQFHTGEKRLIAICKEKCRLLPDDFEENLDELFSVMQSNPRKLEIVLRKIMQNVKKLCQPALKENV